MKKPIRWGILGASKFAREQTGPAIHAANGAVFAGLATSDAAKAEGFLAYAPDIHIYESYEALLAAPEIDAVYIPLPNTMHTPWALKSLEAGKPVLVEKPVSMSVAELDTLIAARDASGILAAEAYMIVHHPQWLRVRALVAEGAIGPLRHVHSIFSYDNRQDVRNIRNRPETGGGALRDIGVYPFGATRFVTGKEPTDLSASIDWDNGVDATARVDAAFDGFTMNALVSMRMYPRQEVTFHGEQGQIRVSAPFNPAVFAEAALEIRAGGVVRTETFPTARHYVNQFEAFGRSLQDGTPFPCPLEFTRGTQAMIDKAFGDAE